MKRSLRIGKIQGLPAMHHPQSNCAGLLRASCLVFPGFPLEGSHMICMHAVRSSMQRKEQGCTCTWCAAWP